MFRVPAIAGPVLERLADGHTYAPVPDRLAAQALGRVARETGRFFLATTRDRQTVVVPSVRTPRPRVVQRFKHVWTFFW